MKRNVFAITIIGMLLLSSFAFAPTITSAPSQQPSNGNILYVGGSGPGNYSNIQDAINASSNGDTVFVYNGIYCENIVVNKTIDLLGENTEETIIDGGGIGDVVEITVDNVNIGGFTIQHPGPINSILRYSENAAIYYDDTASFLDNFNVRFSPEGSCKLAECSLLFVVDESWINSADGVEVIVWDDDGFGFPANELARIQVPKSQIESYPNMTYVDFSSLDITLIGDFHVGYSVVNSADYYAIILDDIDHSENRSSVSYDGDWYNFSFFITPPANNNFNITANVTSFSGLGINLTSSNNSLIKENLITHCEKGIAVHDVCDDNKLYHNNLIDNTQNAYDAGSNTWDNGTEGNYWDDYTGEDNDGDGIGDTPYNISGGDNQDLYPLMNPYGEEEEPEVIITIEEEEPQNNTSNVDINLSNVSVYVDIEYTPWPSLTDDGAYCEIGGDNITTTISTAYFPGRKEAPVEGPLEYGTIYTWYVNVSLSLANVHAWRNETFHFTTEGYNSPPVANFTHSINDLTVTFDASDSDDPDGENDKLNYSWDFDDESPTGYGKIVNHTYKGPEPSDPETIYTVILTVTDEGGKTDDFSKDIGVYNNKPVANFTYTVDGKTVKFVSTSIDENGTIEEYYWTFGDGNNSNVSNPVHTYGAEYTKYKVTLIVNDSAGAPSNPKSMNVTTGDGTDPTVEILKPVKKGVYINGDYKFTRIRMALIIGDITIEVNATDEGSGIEKVEFYSGLLGNKLMGNDTSAPYNFTWTKDRIRFIHMHRLKVVAYDNAGNTFEAKMFVRKIL